MTASVPIEEKIRAALVEAAGRNQSLRRPQFNKLLRYKEEIQQLRQRAASFETIEKILRQNSLHVSHETIRVFYREVIEGKAVRRKRRRKITTRQGKRRAANKARTWSIGEPRIARIQKL